MIQPILSDAIHGEISDFLKTAVRDGFADAWNLLLGLTSIVRNRAVPASPFEDGSVTGLPFWNPLSIYGIFVVSTLAGACWTILVFLAGILGRAIYQLKPFGPALEQYFDVSEDSLNYIAVIGMIVISIFYSVLIVLAGLSELL